MTMTSAIRVFILLSIPLGIYADTSREDSKNEDSSKNKESTGWLPETYITATANPTSWLSTPGSGVLIKQKDFLAFGGLDLGDVVKYDPTVSAPYNYGSADGTFGYGQTGYTGYNIRGIEGNRILMLVDGIRQPELFISTSFGQDSDTAGGAGRDYYDPAMFETTEILKGSASALYGSDALGGVVSFRTPTPYDFFTHTEKDYAGLLRLQYFGSNDSKAGQAFFAFRDDDFSFLLGFAGRNGEETQNNGTERPNPAEFDSQSYLLKFNWEASSTNTFGLTYEKFNRNRFTNALSASSSSFPLFDKQILNWENQERDRFSVRWDYAPEANAWFDTVESQLYFQATSNASTNHSESMGGRVRDQHIDFTNEIYGLQSTFRKSGLHHKLTYGIDVSKSHSENSFQRHENGSFPPPTNRISFAPSDTLRAAMFFQDQYSPSVNSPWFFIGGLRLDYYQITPELSDDYLERIRRISAGRSVIEPAEKHELLSLSPRLDVMYKVSNETSLYAQYSHGIRNPTAEELSMIFDHPPSASNPVGTITIPNPNLEEEKSHSFELGYKHENNAKRLNASVFYNHYTDFIENGVDTGHTAPDGRTILTTVNRGTVDIYGFELGGSWQAGQWAESLQGLEVGLSTGKSWGIDRERDEWLNSIEPWKNIAWIGYTSPDENYGARLTGTYVAKVSKVDETRGELFLPPAYFILDLSAYWVISENLTLNGGVNNLTNEKYWLWSGSRRAGGHIPNSSAVNDRSTAPGTNAFISLTYQF